MSPASRSKSKEKKGGKELQKASSKASTSANAASGVPASAYNPLLGTFHTIDGTSTSVNSPFHSNGRFRNIDDTDEHGAGSVGAGVEYDSVSNNGSWSGESEDHKDKISNPSLRLEPIPGAENDKREKIRQKNERKHQRQKERRAQELHDKCSGYLMSRKLEALAQQLVSMGFSHERATMALILNEGRVEESVSKLVEWSEDAEKYKKDQDLAGNNLKIEISDELARVAEMEMRFKCSKQEVERAVVACEGDLHKASETLRAQKQEPVAAPPKPEETGDPPTINNGKVPVSTNQNSARLQPRISTSPVIQQKKEEKDFTYSKAPQVGGPLDSVSKGVQPMKRGQTKLEWPKPQQTAVSADKRWQNAGSNPSVSYSLASPLQVSAPLVKSEIRTDVKNIQVGLVREPVVMMQRSQSVNTKQVHTASISSSPPATAASWYPTTSVEIMKSTGLPHIPSSRSFGPNDLSSNQLYNQLHPHQQQPFIPGSSQGDFVGTRRGVSSWSQTGTSSTLAAASSLGLFSRLGSTSSSAATSPVDWNSGVTAAQFDYTNIDWSLDRGGLVAPKPGALRGISPFMKNGDIYDPNASTLGPNPGMRVPPANGHGGRNVGLHDGVAAGEGSSSAGSQEWTSPFEGKDLFSLPRQFVSSPSL